MSLHPTPREYADLELVLDEALPDPVRVTVPPELVPEPGEGAALELTDAEGTPVARLTVVSRSEPGPSGEVDLTGEVEPLQPREDGIFRRLRRTPAQLRAELGTRSAGAVVLDAPLDSAAVEQLAAAAKAYDVVVLLPTIAPDAQQVLSPAGLVRAAMALVDQLPVPAVVVPVPLAEPASGDRARRVAAAYGTPLPVPTEAAGTAADYPPGVESVVRAERPPLSERGLVVFFTGLSGSGKSTLARRLRDDLLEHLDRSITLLDGDVVRRILSKGLGFSREDREANIRRIGFVAAEVGRAGGIAVCAPIAPYASTRAEVREMVEGAGATFVLVHVSTPLEECERRDRKGLYARARAGEISEFTGISDPYESPEDADLAIDTTSLPLEDAARQVRGFLAERGLLSS